MYLNIFLIIIEIVLYLLYEKYTRCKPAKYLILLLLTASLSAIITICILIYKLDSSTLYLIPVSGFIIMMNYVYTLIQSIRIVSSTRNTENVNNTEMMSAMDEYCMEHNVMPVSKSSRREYCKKRKMLRDNKTTAKEQISQYKHLEITNDIKKELRNVADNQDALDVSEMLRCIALKKAKENNPLPDWEHPTPPLRQFLATDIKTLYQELYKIRGMSNEENEG